MNAQNTGDASPTNEPKKTDTYVPWNSPDGNYTSDSVGSEDQTAQQLKGQYNKQQCEDGQNGDPEFNDESSYADDDRLSELVESFPRTAGLDYKFRQEDIQEHGQNLVARRILLISSELDDSQFEAFLSLMDSPYLQSKTALRLKLNAANDKDAGLDIMDRLQSVFLACKGDFVLVIDAQNEHNQSLSSALLPIFKTRMLSSIQKLLEDHDKLLVILATPHLFGGILAMNTQISRALPHWSVPFPDPLIRHWFGEEAEQLISIFREQQKRGKWPTDERQLRMEIPLNKRDEFRTQLLSERQDDFVVAGPPQLSADSIQYTILLVACYFPDLPLEEFDRLLRQFLGDQTEQLPPSVDDQDQVKPTPRLLQDIWGVEYPTLLDSCLLTLETRQSYFSIRRSETCLRVCFSRPQDRRAARKLFETRLALHQREFVRSVMSAGLLFDNHWEIAQACIAMAVEQALMRPELYGREWLLWLIKTAGPDQLVEAKGDDILKVLVARIINDVHAERRSHIYQRMADLLREMLGHESLHRMVTELLKQLMEAGGMEVVYQIVCRLPQVPDFDVFYWMKRLLDEAPQPVKTSVEVWLSRLFATPPLAQKLVAIRKWMPDLKPRFGMLGKAPSAQCATKFIVNTFEQIIAPQHRGDPGQWRTQNRILSQLDVAQIDNIMTLIEWLFREDVQTLAALKWKQHLETLLNVTAVPVLLASQLPNEAQLEQLLIVQIGLWYKALLDVQQQFPANDPRSQPLGRLFFHAIVLTELAVLFQGIEDKPLPKGEEEFKTLLSHVAQRLDRAQGQRLQKFWHTLDQSLLKSLHVLGDLPHTYQSTQRQIRLQVRQRMRGTRQRIQELMRVFGTLQRKHKTA